MISFKQKRSPVYIFRMSMGLGQTEFAKKLGVSQSLVSKVEACILRPGSDFLFALLRLGMPHAGVIETICFHSGRKK